ncbi:unnamed protein product [Parajaminaea phylloscopi]
MQTPASGEGAYLSTLFQARQVYVYRIPPRSSVNAGYKANDWADAKTGDLASTAIWKGRLRVLEYEQSAVEGDETSAKATQCEIRLEDADSGEVFAVCPYSVKSAAEAVEPVTDSSRYFVLCVQSGGRKAFVGMGFEDREQSFDFNICLSSWVKQQQRIASGTAATDEQDGSTGPSPHIPKEGAKDLSLKDGQTFSVKIPGSGGRKIRDETTKSSNGGFGGGPLLPPPPSRRG